jgi:hypothetical protein
MPAPCILGTDELTTESAALLPRRDTLSCQYGCVNVTTVVGVNFALAVNAASVNSVAAAVATQYLGSWQ